MQVFQSELQGADRPCAPSQCERCGGRQRLHRHGHYQRRADCSGPQFVDVERFICPRCRGTVGVIPEDHLPYRSLKVSTMQRAFDSEFMQPPPTTKRELGAGPGGGDQRGGWPAPKADGDPRPPPATAVEKGCIRRALRRLSERIPLLFNLFGQQLPLHASGDTGCFWRALRTLGSTAGTLALLACRFNTSLLHCYLSLRANWQREPTPV